MKFFIGFDTIEEAIALLNGAGAAGDDDSTPAAPGVVDPALGVELDANGMPWVAEVHAGTKGKNQDGTWKKRKGVTDQARDAAEKAALAHLKSTAAPAVAPVGMVMPNPAAVAPGIVPGLPTMPTATTLPPVSYEQVTEVYANLAGAGLIDATKMVGIYAELGINPAELGTNETMRRSLYDHLTRLAATPAGLPGA